MFLMPIYPIIKQKKKQNIIKELNIINYLYNEHIIFGLHYLFIDINHTLNIYYYNGIIINLGFKYKNLDSNKNYIYDGLKNNNEIRCVDDLKSVLRINNPYIEVYVKN